jgi:hypothetical protein
MPVLTFRRPVHRALPPDPKARHRELAYLVLVPLLAFVNLLLGLAVLSLAHREEGWKAVVLLICGGALCATAGWLAGVSWLRLHWRSRMEQQMRLWAGVVDAVTGWEEEVGIPQEAALKLQHRLDGLVSKF